MRWRTLPVALAMATLPATALAQPSELTERERDYLVPHEYGDADFFESNDDWPARQPTAPAARDKDRAMYRPENLYDNAFGRGYVYTGPGGEPAMEPWYRAYETVHGDDDDWFTAWGYLDEGAGQFGSARGGPFDETEGTPGYRIDDYTEAEYDRHGYVDDNDADW